MSKSILFVCTGNTCRSPMAEALAKSILQNNSIEAQIRSAGVSAWDGTAASKNAIVAMLSHKLDLSAHKSSQVTQELLETASIVLTMTRGHLQIVQSIHKDANAFTLTEYAGSKGDISDPFGGDLKTYKKCATQIKQLIESSVAKLREDLWKA